MLGFSDIKESRNDGPIIKVIGVGGGGGNAINRMLSVMKTKSVEFVAANTDLQDLKNSVATYKLQLGMNCTKGLGAGAKPKIGREAALENTNLIEEFVSGADMIFITAGMGGGTGTGGAPVIAEISRKAGALTVGVVTLPFRFEGKRRRKNAEKGVEELREHVDTLIVIPNENLSQIVSKRTSMLEAFNLADDVLRQAIQGIADLIMNEGLINLDFADVKTVMQNGGKAVMGVGIAGGDERAITAAEKAIHSPLLSDHHITGAQGVLVNMVGGNNLTMHEVNQAACFIQEQAHEDATIIWGASIQPDQADQIQITVIATNFESEAHAPIPSAQSTLTTEKPVEGKILPISDFQMEDQGMNVAVQFSNREEKPLATEFPFESARPLRETLPSLSENEEKDVKSQNLEEEIEGHFLEEMNPPIQPLCPSNIMVVEKENPEDEGLEPNLASNQGEEDFSSDSETAEVETTPNVPAWAWGKRHLRDFPSDLDIPTFIRRRAKKLGQDFR